MVVKVINKSAHSLPDYATLFSAGMDLRANLKETVLLLANKLLGIKSVCELQVC